jgi:adenosylhomocysteinase
MSTAAQVNGDIKNVELADLGKKRIEWANQSMKVLQIIRKEFIKNQPLKGIRVSACLHVTAETANLAICLRDGGADVVLCASNPLSTQDDVAASLVRDSNIPVFAIKGEDNDTYYNHILAAIDHKPHITMDDGADLVTLLHTKRTDALDGVIGGTEETTTGVIRLRAMAKEGVLKFPIIAVTTVTAPVSPRSTALSAPRISCSPGRSSWSPATAGVAADWPAAPAVRERK